MNIHNVRENNKIGLEMFNLNKENKFDNAIDKLVIDLRSQINDINNRFYETQDMIDNDPDTYSQIVENHPEGPYIIEYQQADTINDLFYYQEELQSIIEMKIINAFKIVEIDIKILIGATFHYKNEKDLYRWELITSYLKSKNIDVTKFKSYSAINELRRVNNAIKHNGEYEKKLTDIPEFNTDKFVSDKLLAFYERVKKSPNNFIDELSTAIYDELYKFNDEKITEIAQSFVLRMSKEDAEKLSNKIVSFYH